MSRATGALDEEGTIEPEPSSQGQAPCHDPVHETLGEAPSGVGEIPRAHGLAIGLVGMAIAAWGAMCGIGGGLFAVPVLHYIYKLRLKDAIVTSLALVAATTISATASEAFRADSAINWAVVGCLVAGSLVGAQLGFRVSRKVKTRPLKVVFIVLLLIVGVRILGLVPESFASGGYPHVLPDLGPWDFATAAMIGLGGGFVAPLLGIGGGLVAVPALLVFLPSLGHLGARACSMAMAVVTSTRSMVLYYRAGELNIKRSASFAIGAAIGAFIGVQLVHIPGVAEVAKKMLAATLLIVAVRFAIDLWGNRGKTVS
jgi:uncharacterized membrane protein YfcA